MNSEKEEKPMIDESKNQKNHPDETGGFYVEGHIKIFDPDSNEVFVDQRS